ncbi:trehalase-like [Periplaneta americana]|uniref:trehalase-like n=1 Tax=Periplaneta americana TaxID=6978 RepID=UPI0037E803AD
MLGTTNLHLLFRLATVLAGTAASRYPQSCNSPIYCYGDLLKTVQLAELYNDSKTFVDLKQKGNPEETLNKFETLMKNTEGMPNKDQVRDFVNDAFEDKDELLMWTPEDWTEKPAMLQTIADSQFRDWASDINVLWKNLSRKTSKDVLQHPEQYSNIYVPNGFIIPGGRFREFYYWDTYWIVQGLLLSEMYDTTRGMLENFLSMVARYGFVPNGGRVYYLERSQPPMLIPMVDSYLTATNNVTFLKNNIQLLEAEFQFWMVNRTVKVWKNGKEYLLARYRAPSSGPRPESYREDYNIAKQMSDQKREDFYINIKSAAESGWDFSSRWFILNGTNEGNLTNIETENIIPVDLNSFLYWNAALLSKFYNSIYDFNKTKYYHDLAEQFKAAVAAVHWCEEQGTWLDYDILNNKSRNYFYPSNLAPLWTKCYNLEEAEYYANKTTEYINDEAILKYLGGIPTSLSTTNQQWDLPNAWPPLQVIVIQGLDYTNDSYAKALAYELAKMWIDSNYKGYQKSRQMFEKYDAIIPGQYGGNGEYEVQQGFGWTNGVILQLLNKYGDRITAP